MLTAGCDDMCPYGEAESDEFQVSLGYATRFYLQRENSEAEKQ